MAPSERSGADSKDPEIRRGRVDSLSIYEATAEELLTIERGSTGADQFNFAVGLLSAGLTLIVSLFTASYPTPTATAVACALTVAAFVLGVFFLIGWFRTKDEVSLTLDRIRSRVSSGDVALPQHRSGVRAATSEPTSEFEADDRSTPPAKNTEQGKVK